MKQDLFLAGQWNHVPLLAVDSWNGKWCTETTKKLLGEWIALLIFWKDNRSEIMYKSRSSEKEMMLLAKNVFLKDHRIFHKIMEGYYIKRKNILKRMDEIEKMPLMNLSNKKIGDLFLKTRKNLGFCGGYDWLPFSFDNLIIEAVDLEQYLKDNPGEKNVILSFALPEVMLPTLEEEIAVLTLAQKSRGLNKEKIKGKYKKEIQEMIQKYKHISALILYPFKTEDSYAEQITKESEKKDLNKILKEKKCYVSEINKRFEKYKKEKKVPQKIVERISAMRKLSEIRAVGELDSLYCFSRSRKLDEEIQKRLKLSKEKYFLLYVREVQQLLEGKKLNIDFNQRKKLEGMYRNSKGEIVHLENAEAWWKKLQEKTEDKKEMKGMPGCPGKATGTVKLILSSNDLSKFKQGDILVAPATCVDYVMIMKKAGAIITEFGGITSHAAVVSRELKVPSVISVSQVTKILKDGDKVEVDANKGIVRKIS